MRLSRTVVFPALNWAANSTGVPVFHNPLMRCGSVLGSCIKNSGSG